MSNMYMYSSFYESTATRVSEMSEELLGVERNIRVNQEIVVCKGRQAKKEELQIRRFDYVVGESINSQELAAYQYRETYVRTKRLAANELYNLKVVQAVQNTSTLNGNAKATAGPGVTVTQLPVNLETPDINDALTTVNTITKFLDSFGAIYDMYGIQGSNYQAISTAVMDQRASLLTLQDLQMNGTADADRLVATSNELNTKSLTTDTLLGTIQLADQQIKALKMNFQKSYETIMRADEITEAETAISSFIVQGINAAVTL